MLTRRVCTNPECKKTFNIKLSPPKKEGICDNCGSPLKQREDDSDPEAIKQRLDIYEEKTSPLVEYYKNKGVLRTETVSLSINRMGTDLAKEIIPEIEAKIKSEMESRIPRTGYRIETFRSLDRDDER